jgi:hypothetical protein
MDQAQAQAQAAADQEAADFMDFLAAEKARRAALGAAGEREYTLTIKVAVKDWTSRGGRAALLDLLAAQVKDWEGIQAVSAGGNSAHETEVRVLDHLTVETGFITADGTRVEGRRQEERCHHTCCN